MNQLHKTNASAKEELENLGRTILTEMALDMYKEVVDLLEPDITD